MTARILAADSVRPVDDFEQDALRVAEAIRERGIGLGDRVMLKAGNSASYVCVLYALMHVGASIVLVDQQEHPEETRRIALRTGVKVTFVDDETPVYPDADPIHLYELMVAVADHEPTAPRPVLRRVGRTAGRPHHVDLRLHRIPQGRGEVRGFLPAQPAAQRRPGGAPGR
ncbi:hypothetical protein GCM10020254_75610 [Streptomyces goshikiensis]